MSDLSEYRRLIAAKRVAAVPTGIRGGVRKWISRSSHGSRCHQNSEGMSEGSSNFGCRSKTSKAISC